MATAPGLNRAVRIDILNGAADGVTLPTADLPEFDVGVDVISVRHISADLVTNDDVTADSTIVGPGQLQVSNATTPIDSTGNFIVIMWAT